MNREDLEQLVRQVLAEQTRACPVLLAEAAAQKVSEEDRLDTGDSSHRVYTHDLFTLSQSPRLGAGIMEMRKTTFPWELCYDEIDYVIAGSLTVIWEGRSVTARPGQVILIPKGSRIRFSVPDYAKFLYVTYPADWQSQGKH